jgi:hypothetical protein
MKSMTEPMDAISASPPARRGLVHVARRMAGLMLVPCALVGLGAGPIDSPILFARDSDVPAPVRAFAWRVIETRCSYQPYERDQRMFWAYRVRAAKTGDGAVYSIGILSERSWKKAEPPAIIEMTIVDEGRMRLAELKSSFVPCSAEHG